MPKKKKEQESLPVETSNENQLKEFVESSEKTLTVNYFLFGLIMLFILITSIFFYINTKNSKLLDDKFSKMEIGDEILFSKQDKTLTEVQKLNLKIDSSNLESSKIYIKIGIIESEFKKLNQVSEKLDTLLINHKISKIELNEK